MLISPIISFCVNLIIYAIFDENLSLDLSARGEGSLYILVSQQIQMPHFVSIIQSFLIF